MKQLFNYHTHTSRCGHAFGSDEEYVLAAIKAGYKILGFSDHCPYRDFPNKRSHMDWEEFPEYVESINHLKEKYKDVIEIKLGIESEYYPEYVKEKEELRKDLDYFILGQHFLNPNGTGSFFKNIDDQTIMIYAKSVCEAMDTGMFEYVCHPDVFMCRQEEFTKACEEAAHMIAKKAVETNTPLEINVHGIRKGLRDFQNSKRYNYPFIEFWQIAAQYPVKVLIGIDAHAPEQLLSMEDIETALLQVKGLDLDFISEPFIN